MGLLRILESNFLHFLQVIIISVLPFHVVDKPRLVGKTVFEMLYCKREGIELWLDSSKNVPSAAF